MNLLNFIYNVLLLLLLLGLIFIMEFIDMFYVMNVSNDEFHV
jgi:hypothetical protein